MAPAPNSWSGTIIATVPVGRIPVIVTPSGANGYVYVANYGSSNVSVINGTKVVATIPVGDGSAAVVYDSGNGYIYVANKLSNNVSVINGTKVVATIPVGPYPVAVGYDAGHGYVYVADQANNMSVINGTKLVTTIPVGNLPFAVIYDPGNGYIYVANKLSNNVSVINGTKVVATIPVGSYPNALGYDTGNGYVYVANEASASVSVINGTKVVATVPGGYGPNAIGSDVENGCVYVANSGSNNVSVIRGTTVAAAVGGGNSPFGVAYDNDGDGNVYVTNRASGTVSVIANATVVATLAVGGSPGGVAHDRLGGHVYVANADSGTVTVIAPPSPSPPAVSVDVAGIQGMGGWFRSPATAVLNATDYGSGVKVVTYQLGGGPWQVYVSALSFSDGTYFLNYTATDWAGNRASVNTLFLRVDSEAPRLRTLVTGTKGASGWFTSQPSISLSASDNGSGVQRITFQLDGAAARNYSGPIILSDGVHRINATAADAAGNIAWSLTDVPVDTNIFSPNGPYLGAPTYGLVLAAAAMVGFFLWRRWRRLRRPPASLP